MRRLIRSTALLGLGSAATVVAAILRAKVLAYLLGPAGTGLLAQLSTLTTMLVPLATLGLGNGVTAMIASARAQGDLGLVRRVRSTSLTLTWLVGLTLAALTALASPWLADALFHDRRWTWVVLVGAAAVPLSAIASLRVSILQGYQAVKAMAGLNGIIALASILTIAPLAWFFRLPGAVAQLVVVAAVYVFASGWLEGRQRDVLDQEEAGPRGTNPLRSIRARIDRALLRPLLRYGSSALLVGLSSTLTLLILRSVLVSKLGLIPNGIYQVCVGISGLYMPLILNSITAIVWPQIAAQRSDEETAATMRQSLRLALLLMTGAGGAMLAGAPIWIPLFYSGKFLPALDLLPLQFVGDYFRTIAWVCGIWLVPKNRLRPWVLFDLVYGVTMLVTFSLFVDRVGIRSVVIAYVAAHLSHAALHYALARKVLGFRLGPDNRRLLLASIALLAGLGTFTPRTLPG
ncbi:MAG TPA: oligosaccharide flippase family protein, partial [Candidatus Binatia bacterium]|nr:oligosaccharide flippase family protein [Candidatus Binatia bacterium]